jgi:cardiolipin synthase
MLPNMLTFLRIALIPAIVIAFYTQSPMGHWVATICFFVACLSDFLDGYFARLLSQTSKLGQFFDPVADKLLVSSVLLLLAGFGYIHSLTLIPALIILCREIFVSGLREFLSSIEVSIPVSRLSKWKTGLQMVALSFLILSPHSGIYGCQIIGEIFLWASAILTAITGYSYLRIGLKHM